MSTFEETHFSAADTDRLRQSIAEGEKALAAGNGVSLDTVVAGADAEQLAAMGTESMMTEPAPCCEYPFGIGQADMEAGQ